ncbi:MAG: hypothetical protein ACREAN_08810, partial [Nitrosopumilaceae archaeon]
HLINEKKFKPKYAREKALNYGKKMLESKYWGGLSRDKKIDVLKQSADFYKRAADLCESLSSSLV